MVVFMVVVTGIVLQQQNKADKLQELGLSVGIGGISGLQFADKLKGKRAQKSVSDWLSS
jgi:hypothetical protein